MQNGEEIRINNAAFLNIGAHKIRFDLFDLKSPGPYRLERLSLYDENGNEIDTSNEKYITKTYNTNYDNKMLCNARRPSSQAAIPITDQT